MSLPRRRPSLLSGMSSVVSLLSLSCVGSCPTFHKPSHETLDKEHSTVTASPAAGVASPSSSSSSSSFNLQHAQTQTHIDTNKPTYIVLRLSRVGSDSEVGWSAPLADYSGGRDPAKGSWLSPTSRTMVARPSRQCNVDGHDRNSCKAQAEWRPVPPGAPRQIPQGVRPLATAPQELRQDNLVGYRLLTPRREASQQSVPCATNTWQPANRVPALR